MSRFLKQLLILGMLGMSASAFAFKMPPVAVEVTTATQKPWQSHVQAIGTTRAKQGVMIEPEINGRIDKILFKSGQTVKAGEPLVELNTDILKAELSIREAEFALAQMNYNRMSSLLKKKAGTRSDLDKALAEMKIDQAQVARAKGRLEQAMIRAPFSGLLGLRKVSIGDFVTPGEALVNLQDINHILVDFSIPEVYLGELKVGQKVIVRTDTRKRHSIVGEVYAMDSAIDPSTRSLTIRAKIDNTSHQFLPGSFVDVELYMGTRTKVTTLPRTAIVYARGGNYVYQVKNGKAIKKPVQLGQNIGDDVIVKSGIHAGDVIVTAGQIKLHPGAAVQVSKTA